MYYKNAVTTIEGRGHKYGCWSPEEFLDTQYAYLDDLHESIRKQGYKRQSEIGSEKKSLHRNVQAGAQKRFHEVMVSIGRDGQFLFDSGKHRLTLAKLLDVDAIPVQIVVRHADWQAIRRDVARDGSEHHDHRDHPDLQDLLDKTP